MLGDCRSRVFFVAVLAFFTMDGQEMIPTLLGPIAPPSKPRRNWLFIAVATPAVLAATVYMYRNRCVLIPATLFTASDEEHGCWMWQQR